MSLEKLHKRFKSITDHVVPRGIEFTLPDVIAFSDDFKGSSISTEMMHRLKTSNSTQYEKMISVDLVSFMDKLTHPHFLESTLNYIANRSVGQITTILQCMKMI